MLPATNATCPPVRRSASQPCSSRPANPTMLPNVSTSPAMPGSMPRSTAAATRKIPRAFAAPAPSPDPAPSTASASVARSPGGGFGTRTCSPPRGRPEQREQGQSRRDHVGPAPADRQRDGRHRRPRQQRGQRDRRLLDAERQPEPVRRHRPRQRQVRRQLAHDVAPGAAEQDRDERGVRVGEHRERQHHDRDAEHRDAGWSPPRPSARRAGRPAASRAR